MIISKRSRSRKAARGTLFRPSSPSAAPAQQGTGLKPRLKRPSVILAIVMLFTLFLGVAPALVVAGRTSGGTSSKSQERMHISNLRALTFYSNAVTTSRRTRPIQQMKCRGKPCGSYQPDVISCQAIGSSGGVGPEWTCQADMPSSIRLGRVQVSCEGWDNPQDAYILKGSCGLEYTLLPAWDADMDGNRRHYERSRLDTLVTMLFWLAFIGALFMIIRSFLTTAGLLSPSAASGGGRPGGNGGGRGSGGWFPGGGGSGGPSHHSSNPPPPYTKYEQQNNPPSHPGQEGTGPGAEGGWWRPGFLTGLGLGGIGASLYASAARERERRRQASWDWDRGGRSYGGPGWGAATGFGGGDSYWPGSNRGAGIFDTDGFGRGPGRFTGGGDEPGPSRRSSSREDMRTSTGFGGTSFR